MHFAEINFHLVTTTTMLVTAIFQRINRLKASVNERDQFLLV